MARADNFKGAVGERFKTGQEQREIARQGGIASGEAKRARKTMAEFARKIAETRVSDKKLVKIAETAGLDEEVTGAAVVASSVYLNAIKGNINAYDRWQQLTESDNGDDKPYELPARVLGKDFVDINRTMVPNKTYIFKGGRGSLKSSFISLKIIEILKNNPSMHCCVVRKVANTLKDSVFSQVKWAIHELGMDEEFAYVQRPPEITYKKTGQKIYFRGADDPIKLKSIKPEFGYIGILWKEEKDQISGPEEERSINQSVLRGGSISYDFSSYNPPKPTSAWVNRELLIDNPNRVVHESNYKDAPPEWLGQKFIDDAEHLKETNPAAYDHEYMGIPTGAGGNVFDDIVVREITKEERERFDRIYQGVDWGWYPDIYAFVRVAYEASSETVYILNENTCNKTPNSETAKWIIDNEFNDYRITCDSAEPKSINDYKDLGLPAFPAIKGPGSVEYSFKWLAGRHIVIDSRCVVAADEFTQYEYERDKEGNVISGYPDHNNHTIDAVRYALESYWTRRGNQA